MQTYVTHLQSANFGRIRSLCYCKYLYTVWLDLLTEVFYLTTFVKTETNPSVKQGCKLH